MRIGAIMVLCSLILCDIAWARLEALNGARQGCLGIKNETNRDIAVYLRGSNDDGDTPVRVEANTFEVLYLTEGHPLLVSEDTVIWGRVFRGLSYTDYPKSSLKNDPNAYFTMETAGQVGCERGA